MSEIVSFGSFTAEMANTVHRISCAQLPGHIIERARHALLDWTACALAGSTSAVAQIGREVISPFGEEFSSTVIGTDVRASARDAAFANSLASHATDFDSSTPWAWGHPVVPLISATLSLAEERDSSGEKLVEAIVAGFETSAILGLATARGLNSRGFHRTGLIGTFAAAAGCAKLLELDPIDLRKVFSLAATQAAGLKLVLSTMGKSLNAARAAEAGILSAKLVQKGFTAPGIAIEGPSGYAAAFEEYLDVENPKKIMRGRYGIENNFIKFHACCHATHSAIEGLRKLRAENTFALDEVEYIALEVPASTLEYCGVMEPCTSTESMFSFPHAAALAILGESTGPNGFTKDRVINQQMRAMRGRVRVIPSAEEIHGAIPTRVTVGLQSGATLQTRVSVFEEISESDLPRVRARVEEKFINNAASVLGEVCTARVISLISGVTQLRSVRELAPLLRK